MDKLPILIYRNWLAVFLALTDDQVGLIMHRLAEHVINGEAVCEGVPPSLRPIVEQIAAEVDSNLESYIAKCEKNAKTAEERERKRRERETLEAQAEHERDTNVQQTCNERGGKTKTKTKTKNNVITDVITEIGDTPTKSSQSTVKMERPTLEDVQAFVIEKGYDLVNPVTFFNYYESNGWRVGKNPMKNWRAAAASWQSKGQRHINETTTRVLSTPKKYDDNLSYAEIIEAMEANGDL